MSIKVLLILIGIFSISFGCSQVKSGKYVQLKSAHEVENLADQFQVPMWQIQLANPGVEFSTGNWIFIPMPIGVLRHRGPEGNNVATNSLSSFGDEFLWPVPSVSRVSSGFGTRQGRPHHGIDIPAKQGTPIVATSDGVVAYAGSELKGYGHIIVISHASGMFSVYAHNKINFVREGQAVKKGEQVALVGSSGRSTGPHLHFEIRYYNRPIDPLVVLRKPDYGPDRSGAKLAMRQ